MMAKLSLRPTGSTVLVGLIDVPPGGIKTYEDALQVPLEKWYRSHVERKRETKENSTIADPKNFYKTSSYLGIGSWNFITFTLVMEHGLANQLAFLGNVRGQNFFRGNDYSVVIEPVDKTDAMRLDRFHQALADLDISDFIKVRDDWCDSYPKGKGKARKKQWKDALGLIRKRAVVYNLDGWRYMGELRPITLESLYSGARSLYGADVHDELKGPRVSEKANRLFTRKSGEHELMGIYQLKCNQHLVTIDYPQFMTMVYIAILLTLHREAKVIGETKGMRNLVPSFFRPLFSDSSFDLTILLRGRQFGVMDHLLNEIKAMCIRDAVSIYEEYEIEDAFPKSFLRDDILDQPLVSLSYSTLAVPYSKVAKEMSKLGKCLETMGDTALGWERGYRSIDFDCYSKKAVRKKEKNFFLIRPKTSLSVKVSRIGEVIRDIDRYMKITGEKPPKRTDSYDSRKEHTCGRHEFELFPGGKLMTFGEFLRKFLFARRFFTRKGHVDVSDYSLFRRRVLSPTLEIIPWITFKYGDFSNKELPRSGRNEKGVSTLQGDATFRILSARNIINVLWELSHDGGLKRNDHLKAVMARRVAFWIDEAFSSEPLDDLLKKSSFGEWSVYEVFFNFVNKFFGDEVTHETKERLVGTFYMLDSRLAEPLCYHLYLDVADYVNELFACLFTLRADNSLETEEVNVYYYSLYSQKEQSYQHISNETYYGLEAFFIDYLDFLQRVLDQRQLGTFPNHDRNSQRLSDLRVQHGNKMMSLSWMIRVIGENMSSSLVRSAFGEFDDPMIHFDDEIHLPCFSTAPEALVNSYTKSISLNARLFTNIEGIITLVHELGHILLNNKRVAEYAWSIDLDPLKGYQRKPPYKDMLLSMLFVNAKKRARDWWEEICSDLLVYKLCFAPLNDTFFTGAFNRDKLGLHKAYSRPRIDVFDADPNKFDICDDFVRAWAFNFFLLPKIKRLESFDNTVIRLAIMLGCLKYFKYKDQSFEGLNVKECTQLVWEDAIRVFFEKGGKFETFLDELDSCGLIALSEGLWYNVSHRFQSQPNAGFIKTELGKLIRHHKKSHLGRVIQFLSTPSRISSPETNSFFRPVLLKSSYDLFPLVNGLLPAGFEEEVTGNGDDGTIWFAAALQLAGTIYFGFVQDWKNSDFRFISGYPGFDKHREQKALAKCRQLVHTFLTNGTMARLRSLKGDSDEVLIL